MADQQLSCVPRLPTPPNLGYEFPFPQLQDYLNNFNSVLNRTFVMIQNDLSPGFGDEKFLYHDGTRPLTGNWNAGYDVTFNDLTLSAPSNIYALSHDSFTDFVVNEHIDHTSVSISTGTGLTGGGDISANRTLALSHLGLESLSDPNADTLLGWDDTDGGTRWFTVGAGLSYTHATHTLSVAAGGGSYWTLTGSDIYYASGLVGINTNAPSTSLHVIGEGNAVVSALIQNDPNAVGAQALGKRATLRIINTNAAPVTPDGDANLQLLNVNGDWTVQCQNDGHFMINQNTPLPIKTRFDIDDATGGIAIQGALTIGAYTLPNTDGNNGEVLVTNGAGAAAWAAAAGGGVTADANITDHAVVRGDGGVKKVQDSGVIIDDADSITGIVNLSATGTGHFGGDLDTDGDLKVDGGINVGAATGAGAGQIFARNAIHAFEGTLAGYTPQARARMSVEHGSDHCWFEIASLATKITGIMFSDPAGVAGRVRYSHADNDMQLWTAGVLGHTLDSSQNTTLAGGLNVGTRTGAGTGEARLSLLNLQVANDPGAPTEGDIWYNTTTNLMKYYDGANVIVIGKFV